MTTVSNLPAVPSRGNSSTFSALFEAFLTALKDVFVGQVNAVAGEVNANAATAASAAGTATAAAGTASSASALAVAAANFKGSWAGLSGALATPASASHGGRLWMLNANVADVTTKVPGVAPEWQLLFGRSVDLKADVQPVAASDIDWALSTFYTKTIAGVTTLTFSHVPTDRAALIVLELTVTAGTLAVPAACKWVDDVAPYLATGKTHLLFFLTSAGTSRIRMAALPNYTT